MIKFVVDSSTHAPSLLEVEPILLDIQGPVIVGWRNTREEQALIQKHLDLDYILLVKDCGVVERTTYALGLPIQYPEDQLKLAKESIVDRKKYNWRSVGLETRKSAITKIAADAIRAGRNPLMAKVVWSCMFDGANPLDADVLLRLCALKR